MALVKKTSSSTRLVIVGLIVVVVAGVGWLLFRQFFLNPGTGGSTVNGADRSRAIITNFGESILNDSRYTELRSFGETVSADANVDGGQAQPFR